jgi:hypothetical protein
MGRQNKTPITCVRVHLSLQRKLQKNSHYVGSFLKFQLMNEQMKSTEWEIKWMICMPCLWSFVYPVLQYNVCCLGPRIENCIGLRGNGNLNILVLFQNDYLLNEPTRESHPSWVWEYLYHATELCSESVFSLVVDLDDVLDKWKISHSIKNAYVDVKTKK